MGNVRNTLFLFSVFVVYFFFDSIIFFSFVFYLITSYFGYYLIMSLKRKTEEELFKNKFTMKNRKRFNEMINQEKKIDDAKKANLVNEIYHIKKLKIIKKGINVDVVKREKLKNKMKKNREFIKYEILKRNNNEC